MSVLLTLPRLGETMESGRVVGWLKRPGETFRRGETLVEIESDKTVVELPALADGRLLEVIATEGSEVEVGAPLCRYAAGDDAAPTPATPTEPPTPAPGARQRATPAARRLARARGIDLAAVQGSGRRGRIEASDLRMAETEALAVRRWPLSTQPRCHALLLHGFGGDAQTWAPLASLLALTGPVQVPGLSQPISAANVAPVVLNQIYANYPPGSSQAARREVLSSVADATIQQMQATHVDVAALANALAHDAGGRHLLLWDSVPSNEATITRFGASGAVDATNPTGTFHVAVENGSANKLDYYVHVSQSEHVVVTPSNTADVTTTITMDNTAPVGAAPSYVFGPDYVNTFTPGEYIARVYLWGPRGSTQYGSVPESGLELAQTTQQLDAGQTATVQFSTVIPHAVRNGQLHLTFVPQPRLDPVPLSVHVFGERRAVSGPTIVDVPLTKTLSYSWAAGS